MFILLQIGNSMVYALNVFNIKSGMEETYRKYSILAGKIIYSKGGRVISSGINPIRNMHGDLERKYMIVVEFPSEEVFQEFIDEADADNIHHLRGDSTSDYIWTLYENWNIKEWVNK